MILIIGGGTIMAKHREYFSNKNYSLSGPMIRKKSVFLMIMIFITIILLIVGILDIFNDSDHNEHDILSTTSLNYTVNEVAKILYDIDKKLNISVPDGSKVLNYDSMNEYGEFAAKILIKSDDIVLLKKQVDDVYNEKSINGIELRNINFINSHYWWDLEEDYIDVWYNTFVSEEFKGKIYSYHIFIFITKEIDGNHYIYIVY